jgi:hypothetical protein
VAIPADAETRLLRLNGVNAAGSLGPVDVGTALVRSVPIPDPLAQTEFQIAVYGGSPGLLEAVRGELATGRWFDWGHSERADRVAILGTGAAQRLNVTRVDQQPVVFVGEEHRDPRRGSTPAGAAERGLDPRGDGASGLRLHVRGHRPDRC